MFGSQLVTSRMDSDDHSQMHSAGLYRRADVRLELTPLGLSFPTLSDIDGAFPSSLSRYSRDLTVLFRNTRLATIFEDMNQGKGTPFVQVGHPRTHLGNCVH